MVCAATEGGVPKLVSMLLGSVVPKTVVPRLCCSQAVFLAEPAVLCCSGCCSQAVVPSLSLKVLL